MTPEATPANAPPGHCFVTGCPRSGTSAITRLLNAHQGVVIGEERYRFLVRDLATAGRLDEFGPELFEADRFLDVKVEQSGYPRDRFAGFFDKAEHRLRRQQMRWVGDKLIPPTRELVDAWADQFPDVRVVFIHRDPVQVAGSFQRRADDPDDIWPSRLGYRRMPRLWGQTVEALDHALDRLGAERVHVVAYEDLFSGDDAELTALCGFLDLDPDQVHRRWERFVGRAELDGPTGLSPRRERWVRERAAPVDRPTRAGDA